MAKKIKDKKQTKDTNNIKRRRKRLERVTGLDWSDVEPGQRRIIGERALWRAVLLQMLEDTSNNGTKKEDLLNRHIARRWLEGNHKDFYIICDLAGLDISYARGKIKRSMMQRDIKTKQYEQKALSSAQAIKQPSDMRAHAMDVCDVLFISRYLKKSA